MQSLNHYSLIDLQLESMKYDGKLGTSAELYCHSFFPAFYDQDSDLIFLSKYANGELASCHVFDGLPEELIRERDNEGRVIAIKASVKSGFVREGLFFSREELVKAFIDSV